MNTHQRSMHAQPTNPEPHRHDDGLGLMRFLGFVQQTIAHNSAWMSDYRTTRLVPASNKVIVGTILVLAVGVVLGHVLPTNYSGIALAVIIAAAAHLALLVVGGLSVALFIRHQRTLVRGTVLRSIPWQGTETVLDVGCGTGMLLNGCAQRLTTGKAIGIDLWQESVAGSPNVLMANARAEGIADKIEYQNMDARHLTFEDARFNMVVSSLALHHIGHERADKDQAVREMIRVLAPGGYLSLADVESMIAIAESVIEQSGLQLVSREQTHFVHFVTARKA